MGLLPEALLSPFAGALTIEVSRLAALLRNPRRSAAQALDKGANRAQSADAKVARA
jgi:hypothetical protein